jgi:hypothetical protein
MAIPPPLDIVDDREQNVLRIGDVMVWSMELVRAVANSGPYMRVRVVDIRPGSDGTKVVVMENEAHG